MIGSACKDEKTTLSTLKRIKQVGYDGIELNLFMIENTPFIVRLLTKMAGMPVGKGANIYWPDMLKESRLKATSLHADLGSLENRIDEVISKARELDTNKIVITGMYRFNYGNYDDVKSLAKRLDKVGARLHESDLQLLYHNHNVEFLKVDNKYTAYEMILKDTDPDLVKVEFDSYWPAEAGVAHELQCIEIALPVRETAPTDHQRVNLRKISQRLMADRAVRKLLHPHLHKRNRPVKHRL